MGNFERYLSVWVALAIVAGIALGQVLPGVFGALAGFEYANVNFAVAIAVSSCTKQPPDEVQATVESIRYPLGSEK